MMFQQHGTHHRGRQIGVAPLFRMLGEGQLAEEGVEAVIAVLHADGLPAVPAGQLARARRIGTESRSPGMVPALRRLVATLVSDLRPQMLPVGVRAVGLPGHWMLFTADDYEVVIQAKEDPEVLSKSYVMTGQISRDGEPIAHALVQLGGQNRWAEVDADHEGNFTITGVKAGRYELDVQVPDDLIACAPIIL